MLWFFSSEAWKEGSLRTLLKDPDRNGSDPMSSPGDREIPGKTVGQKASAVFLDHQFAAANQFRFRRRKSTTDAILAIKEMISETTDKYVFAIFFDIKGAFDYMWWPSIFHRLRERDCPRNLFF